MEYDWSDLLYSGTPVEIVRAIINMEEEELILAFEVKYGGEVVVMPFWVTRILLTRDMKERMGLGEMVALTI